MKNPGEFVRYLVLALLSLLSPLTPAVLAISFDHPLTQKLMAASAAGDTIGQSLKPELRLSPADIQDTILGWRRTRFQFAGIDGFIVATARYDGKLILAGAFDIAHNLRANNIIAWDGVSWSTLGSGIDQDVTCLVVYKDKLIAGGGFSTAGGAPAHNIAEWDGTTWQPLKNGIPTGHFRHLEALLVQDSLLYAAGVFDSAGTVAANNIACWNGSEWLPLGPGTSGRVSALTSYQGSVIAGGQFAVAGGVQVHSVASWNGATWLPLGQSINQVLPDVQDLAVYQNQLIAVGSFTVNEDESKRGVAAWDGTTWSSLGLGTNSVVRSVATYHNRLYISGWFSMVGGIPARGFAVWDGSAWSRVGSPGENFTGAGNVYDLFPLGEVLAVAGHFDGIGDVVTSSVAYWNDTAWFAIGTDTTTPDIHVNALTLLHDGNLIAGGVFSVASGTHADGVAYWDQVQSRFGKRFQWSGSRASGI
jgi:hypothetical protein